jgi:outer membrane receptor protein involved in Fe transport
MSIRSRAAILLGTTILAGTACGMAQAQTAASGSSIETVTVTAEKRTESAQKVPMSISVIGEDELNKLNIRSYEDLMNNVPGLSVSEADPSHPVLTLRGINAGGDGSTVGTYLDETPYGSSNALANGTDTAPNLDTFDMQRVEVLRGPQGTLYGAGSEGGLIKFVTNAPDTTGFDDAFELGAITMAHGGLGNSVRGMVNVALTDNLAVRVVGFDVRTPGYINSPALGLSNVNDVTSFGGRASILYKPTDKISIRLNVLQQQLDDGNTSDEDVVVGANGKISPLAGNYNQYREFLQPNGVRYFLYNGTIDWDFDFATLTSATSYTKLHDYTFGDDSGLFGAPYGVQGFLNQGKFIQEVRLASDPGTGPLDWLVGFYYANEHDGLHQDVVPGFKLPGSIESLNLQSTYIETTGFANATYHVLSNLDIGAGVRYANDSQNSAETIIGAGRVAGGVSQHNILTWSGDARYHLDDQTMIYGRVATGWRPGGPNDLPPGAPASVPKTYNPDSLINYELGVKGTLPNYNLSFDADVYDIEWRDIQILETVNNFNIDGNGGRANSKGAEANMTWQPLDRLTFDLNGSYTDAALSEDAPVVGARKGNALPYAPRWTGTLSGDYEFMPIDEYTPYIGASAHYIGIRGWGYNTNPLLPTTPPFANAIPEGTLPGYATLDVRVGVSMDRWSVELYGKNINEAKGISAFSAYGGSAAALGPNTLAPGLPPSTASIIQPRIFGIVLRGKL